jgi:hypothetical protein
MLRLRERYELFKIDGLRDRRTGKRQATRPDPKIVEEICRLKRDVYADFSVRHFHEFVAKRHKLKISYTWTRVVLQARGLVLLMMRTSRCVTDRTLQGVSVTHETSGAWRPGHPSRRREFLFQPRWPP